jgi:hypothetical protein
MRRVPENNYIENFDEEILNKSDNFLEWNNIYKHVVEFVDRLYFKFHTI